MFRSFSLSLLLLTVVLPSSASAVELIVNGDFSGGLTGWTATGPVDASSGEAILSDDDCGAPCSRLYQGVSAIAGNYVFSFDLLNNLSSDVDLGAFPDTVFGTLYFTSNLGTFDIDGGIYDSADATFDADSQSGITNLPVTATLGASVTKGQGWLHFSMPLVLASTIFVIPTFELFDLNGFIVDSEFRIDNVSLTREDPQTGVPEPGTLVLLGVSGLLGVVRRKKLI